MYMHACLDLQLVIGKKKTYSRGGNLGSLLVLLAYVGFNRVNSIDQARWERIVSTHLSADERQNETG